MGNTAEILSLKLNYASSLPLFLQAAYLLNRKIADGEFLTEGRLPTVKELSDSSQVPSPVIEQAYKMLAQKEVLGYEKSRGYYLRRSLEDRIAT